MYALPHHTNSFDAATKAAVTGVQLQTTTKGIATAVLANQWTMVEPALPVTMNFAPYSPMKGSVATLPEGAKSAIRAVAAKEISQNIMEQVNKESMYWSGKVSLIWSRRAPLFTWHRQWLNLP